MAARLSRAARPAPLSLAASGVGSRSDAAAGQSAMEEDEGPGGRGGHLLASSEADLFSERAEALRLIRMMLMADGGSSPEAAAGALSRFRAILDGYLECPTLLDPHLERMAGELAEGAREAIHGVFLAGRGQWRLKGGGAGGEEDEGEDAEAARSAAAILLRLRYPMSALYALSKVRGRKRVQRFLPHGTDDVEPVLRALRLVGAVEKAAAGGIGGDGDGDGDGPVVAAVQDALAQSAVAQPGGPSNEDGESQWWEATYILLTWLGMLSLVPFDLTIMDSSSSSSSSIADPDPDLASSILSASRSHLSDPGPNRDAASSCLASLLSRPDLESRRLEDFAAWSDGVVARYLRQQRRDRYPQEERHDPSLPLLVLGTIQALAQIYKSGSRSNLMGTRHRDAVERLWNGSILLADAAAPAGRRRAGTGPSGGAGGSPLLRKLLTKLFARVGASYLPPRIATWRYDRGGRGSLLENLAASSSVQPSVGKALTAGNEAAVPAKKDSALPSFVRDPDGADDEDEYSANDLFHVPDQVEDAMAQLLLSLTDPSTMVRWSAAKGVGRITERLPAVCADDVLDAILSDLFIDADRDGAWHGGCLALAELARRGLLLPKRLGEVVPVVVRATQYDVRRGQHSVGAHVRDAASYACWAFARAYSAEVLRPFVPSLAEAIVLSSLFDREVNCRRAASAAFQECVGRQGADNFKHGIAILTAADYFSLGNRSGAYLSVAVNIAQYSEYCRPIIRHLFETKLGHWDSDIRTLAAKALHNLTSQDQSFFHDTVLPILVPRCTDQNLTIRHGAVLGCAEISLALGKSSALIRDSTASSLAGLVSEIEKARLYRGRGGEMMRSAVCRLIECIALTRLPLSVKQSVELLDTIDTCLKHPNEEIQQAAASAIGALMRTYFPVGANGPSGRLQKRVIDKYVSIVDTEDNPAATRGYSLALGRLPKKLLAPNPQVLNVVLRCLSDASRVDARVGDAGDAETRRNAISSIVSISREVDIVNRKGAGNGELATNIVGLDEGNISLAFSSLLASLNDYNTDRRGDVGSWCRVAAMKGLVDLTILTVQENGLSPLFFNERLCIDVVGALLKQLSEKLDNVRQCAGSCLERLLCVKSPQVPFVPEREHLMEVLGLAKVEFERESNWANPAITFPLVMKAASINEFFEFIVCGLVISVGGLTESVTKHSTAALLSWTRGDRALQESEGAAKLGNGEFVHVFLPNLCRPTIKPNLTFFIHSSHHMYPFVIVLLRMFDLHHRDGRVILPLLKTLDVLLSHGSLEPLIMERDASSPNINFASSLMSVLVLECKNCSDVQRLIAAVSVALGLLDSNFVSSCAQESANFFWVTFSFSICPRR